jgi:hypothetical protein
MAPRSETIENTATGRPLRPPAASPTAAPGAVPMNAAAAPKTQSSTVSTMTFGANGIATINTPATANAPTMAGRRPTVSTKRAAGASASACTTAAHANAMPVDAAGARIISTTSSGISELRTPIDAHPLPRFASRAPR